MTTSYIKVMERKGLILYPRYYRIGNVLEVMMMIDNCQMDAYDILNIDGIGKLFIRDIRLDEELCIIIDCIQMRDNKLMEQYLEEEWGDE